jgi:hypothetical protein
LLQLNDVTTYTKVEQAPTVDWFSSQIQLMLIKNSIVNTKFSDFILQFNKSKKTIINCKFYLTIKIHKNPISARPIAASIGTPTYYLSVYLDRVLQPIIKKQITSYISNSSNLILKLQEANKNLHGKSYCLLTADVESLYPSIDICDGLSALKVFLTDYSKSNSFQLCKQDIVFILDCAEFILNNNYLEFGCSIWKQIKGTAMGTPFAVTFACIFMHVFEQSLFRKMIYSYQYFNNIPLYYFRFIDDIFGIFKNYDAAIEFVEMFNALKPNQIKLKVTNIGNNVEMLDLMIFVNNSNTICTKLFQKPQNMYLYFPPCSFHQTSIFKSFIQSEIKRYRICCTNDSDFESAVNNFKIRLLARGYKAEYLTKVMNIKLNRCELLNKVLLKNLFNHENSNYNNSYRPIIFKTTFTSRQKRIKINECLAFTESLWADQKSEFIFDKKRKAPLVSYKRSNNLKEKLISSKFIEE